MPAKTRAARVVAAFVALLSFALLVAGPVRADTESDLKAAEAKLDKLLAKISDETNVVKGLQSDIDVLAQKINEVEDQIGITKGQIADTQADIAKAGRDLHSTQEQLDRRAWVAYENGPGTSLEFLLGSKSLADLSDRMVIVNRAAQSDEDLIIEIREKQNELHIKQVKLKELEDHLAQVNQSYHDQQSALQDKLSQARDVLAQMEKDKAEATDQVQQLRKKRAAEIAAYKAYLAKLAAAKAAAEAAARAHPGGGTPSGGGIPSVGGMFQVCPVGSPRGYVDSFGAPRYGGGYHPHAGNDIMAPLGTPIYAPFSGTASVNSNSLGGLAVNVSGSQGWVYNAHLSRIGTTGSVSAGTVVGYVGNSGDAAGGATHDHFEWHPYSIPSNLWVSPYGYSIIGSAIDPYPYLNAVC